MTVKFNRLTRASQRALSSGRKISEHGIDFEKLSNGDGRYTINVMVDGRRIHRVVGKESEGVTRLQAEELIAKLRTDSRHGRFNLPKGRKTILGFKEAGESYIKKQINQGAKNLIKKQNLLRQHLIPYFKEIPLNQIDISNVEEYKKFRGENNAKPATINRELAILSHLFSKAREWKWIENKPAVIKRYKEEQTKFTYLTVEQIERLIEATKQDQHWQVYLFTIIGLETAMRRMEILSIELKDINLERRMIYIPHAKADARQQPITANLADILLMYIKTIEPGQRWLFPSKRSASGHTMNIEKSFRRVVRAAGLNPEEILRHTLRHTAITHLVQAGVDLPTVKRISGHKTLQMVERYSHQNGNHIQAAMDKLEKRYHHT
jgi:integrase